MGFAASFIARLLNKHRWIAYVGLLIILYVALKMMWDGGCDIDYKMNQVFDYMPAQFCKIGH
jgi:predicted tellurium resistance membrane protein TerC